VNTQSQPEISPEIQKTLDILESTHINLFIAAVQKLLDKDIAQEIFKSRLHDSVFKGDIQLIEKYTHILGRKLTQVEAKYMIENLILDADKLFYAVSFLSNDMPEKKGLVKEVIEKYVTDNRHVYIYKLENIFPRDEILGIIKSLIDQYINDPRPTYKSKTFEEVRDLVGIVPNWKLSESQLIKFIEVRIKKGEIHNLDDAIMRLPEDKQDKYWTTLFRRKIEQTSSDNYFYYITVSYMKSGLHRDPTVDEIDFVFENIKHDATRYQILDQIIDIPEQIRKKWILNVIENCCNFSNTPKRIIEIACLHLKGRQQTEILKKVVAVCGQCRWYDVAQEAILKLNPGPQKSSTAVLIRHMLNNGDLKEASNHCKLALNRELTDTEISQGFNAACDKKSINTIISLSESFNMTITEEIINTNTH
jgi:hypothetical protein